MQFFAQEPSNTLVLPNNNSLEQFQRIMKSSLNIKLIFEYNNTIAQSLIKNSAAPLEAEGGVYSVPCLEYSDKCYGETDYKISQYQDISA